MPTAVIFDLDGCLVDSRAPYLACVRYAFDKLGLPPRTAAQRARQRRLVPLAVLAAFAIATALGTSALAQVGGGRELVLEAEEVERAGPAHLDRADDLLRLRFLNETAVIHTLRTRHGRILFLFLICDFTAAADLARRWHTLEAVPG